MGQKYGNKFPELAKVIRALDPNVVGPVFLSGQSEKVVLEK